MATRKTAARPKKSKPETVEEFEQIAEEMAAAREMRDVKSDAAERARDIQIKTAIDGISVDDVVRKLSGLGLEVSRALADISEKLADEVRLLAVVREAVALERRELEDLHKIDIAATSLDQLVEEHARQAQLLEAQIAAKRSAWQEEAAKTERDRKEQDEALKKQRQREADEFEYKKTLERKKQQDKHDEDLRTLDKANRERQETLEKDWQRRDAGLKEREESIERLDKEVAGIDVKVQQAVEATEARVRRETEQRFEQQILVLTKDAAAEKRFAELQVKSLEQSLKQANVQAAALEKQLSDAKQQVQDIAVKAIEGASGSRALGHINQIAMEQAKNRPQG
jgi:colicin import membrane protein